MRPLHLSQNLKKTYRNEITTGFGQVIKSDPGIVTENDIQHLPKPVQNYLRYVGVIGKPKVISANVQYEGQIRKEENKGWMKFKSKQYNFYYEPIRVLYTRTRKAGINSNSLHLYKDSTASMVVNLAGMIKVVDAKGPEMNLAETVTIFNDMCLVAPATLISKTIEWKRLDDFTVKARFTNGNISITATLFFNEEGELTNFISYDRFECADGKTYFNYPWSTPLSDYKDFNGIRLASKSSVIYHRPGKDFVYGRFSLKNVEYNRKSFPGKKR